MRCAYPPYGAGERRGRGDTAAGALRLPALRGEGRDGGEGNTVAGALRLPALRERRSKLGL
ncbi:hypothetical protein CDU00_14605 [Cronobacter sakazakii]|nr:hypothetical protein C5960_20300 [Cronobacter sakazakii]PUV31860.1 hypothetical protein CDU00_14605 [Cronobacter sakazakii]RRA30918.1 hypothetical protein C3O70_19125 [Cronobacter sakazakii]